MTLGLTLLSSVPLAASQVHWTTNHYHVEGSTFRDIRKSIAHRRPPRVKRDALTEWNVRVRFAPARIRGEYRCSGFTTITSIRITVPRWRPTADTPEHVVTEWTAYHQRLMEHEVGHGRIAEAAAREMHRRVAAIGTLPDPDQVHSAVERIVRQTLEEYREREREYDRLTRHGMEQEATPPTRRGSREADLERYRPDSSTDQ
jgi:predicted secreted Zn-dependent protease